MPYNLTVNGQHQSVDADPSTPLLWVLRDHLGMTGTKYGCGIAQCGACTVHIDGNPTRSRPGRPGGRQCNLPRHRQAHPLDTHPQARSDLGLAARIQTGIGWPLFTSGDR